jgi:hypothetical protein
MQDEQNFHVNLQNTPMFACRIDDNIAKCAHFDTHAANMLLGWWRSNKDAAAWCPLNADCCALPTPGPPSVDSWHRQLHVFSKPVRHNERSRRLRQVAVSVQRAAGGSPSSNRMNGVCGMSSPEPLR